MGCLFLLVHWYHGPFQWKELENAFLKKKSRIHLLVCSQVRFNTLLPLPFLYSIHCSDCEKLFLDNANLATDLLQQTQAASVTAPVTTDHTTDHLTLQASRLLGDPSYLKYPPLTGSGQGTMSKIASTLTLFYRARCTYFCHNSTLGFPPY